MNYLLIDLGSYSVKFTEALHERKSIKFLRASETIIEEGYDEIKDTQSLVEAQISILKEYFDDSKFEGKIILQLPHFMVTNRILDLPVKNKKKAELMIPYQMEEDLPFNSTDIHFASQLRKTEEGFRALCSICRLEEFDEFHRQLVTIDLQPSIITSDVSMFQNYISFSNRLGDFALLDLGHSSTKIYLFKDGELITTHLSYIAGKKVTEAIAKTYDISYEDAVQYKHQNSFFLNESQYDEVDSDQIEFAKLMKRIFIPLLNDLDRWILGTKVSSRTKIKKIYLCGGTSRIHNIDSFFTENLEIDTEVIRIVPDKQFNSLNISKTSIQDFSFNYLESISINQKLPMINFLKGDYAAKSMDDIPLHSISFIFSRVAIVSLILLITLTVKNIILSGQQKGLDKTAKLILKNPLLKLNQKGINAKFKNSPHKVLDELEKRKKELVKEKKIILQALKVNAVIPLLEITKVSLGVDGNNRLEKYSASSNSATAVFKSKTKNHLNEIESIYKDFNIKGYSTEVSRDDTTLTLTVDIRGNSK